MKWQRASTTALLGDLDDDLAGVVTLEHSDEGLGRVLELLDVLLELELAVGKLTGDGLVEGVDVLEDRTFGSSVHWMLQTLVVQSRYPRDARDS